MYMVLHVCPTEQGVWQAECAAAAMVLIEVLWGAATQLGTVPTSPAAPADKVAQVLPPIVLCVAQAWTAPTRWQLPTTMAQAHDAALTGVVTVNVLWLRVAVEGLGVLCRCVGPSWGSNGLLVRHTLLPLLQRTGAMFLYWCFCTGAFILVLSYW